MIEALIALAALAVVFGLALGYAAVRYKVEGDPLVNKIDALLPQTQCGQCTYPGCRPYAEAMAKGEADINQCPPGGETTIIALADLLGREPKPLNPENGVEEEEKSVVVIIEEICIGCTLCIQACPVDAILGAAKQMHTVIESECTGCDLCIPPCPVECIEVVKVKSTTTNWKWDFPNNLPEDTVKNNAADATNATNIKSVTNATNATNVTNPTTETEAQATERQES